MITHFLYLAKLEICPPFSSILMKHRGIEIIVRILQTGKVKMEKLIEKKEEDGGF